MPLAVVSVAVSAWPGMAGVYRTVTLHDLFGPRLVPVQLSAVLVKAPEPASVIFSTAVAESPKLVRVNALERVCPA